jgi:hypothetical protein
MVRFLSWTNIARSVDPQQLALIEVEAELLRITDRTLLATGCLTLTWRVK